MIINEKDTRQELVMSVARSMMAAARTAPKGKGIDNLEIITVCGDQLAPIAAQMRRYSEQSGLKFFLRDAVNVEECNAAVIIGTRIQPFGLNCGYCGFDTCADKQKMLAVPCAFNVNDLGGAVVAAAAVASDNRVDSRIMYSAAKAAMNLGLLPGCTAAYAVLLSVSGKNPFFDRVSHK